MDTSAQLIATFQQLVDHIIQLYLSDLDALNHLWVILYFPIYILRWVYILMPVLLIVVILVGGIRGIRSGNCKN